MAILLYFYEIIFSCLLFANIIAFLKKKSIFYFFACAMAWALRFGVHRLCQCLRAKLARVGAQLLTASPSGIHTVDALQKSTNRKKCRVVNWRYQADTVPIYFIYP
jgi:hypothetical protein